MQGAVLPLYRLASGHQKRVASRRLTSAQLQGIAFFTFISLLCVYVAYYVRTLKATATRQQSESQGRSKPGSLSPLIPTGSIDELPEPLSGPETIVGAGMSLPPDSNSDKSLVAPGLAAFSSFRHPRRDGQSGSVRSHPHQQAQQQLLQQQQQEQRRAQLSNSSGVGQQAAQHMASREHVPSQVRWTLFLTVTLLLLSSPEVV